MSFSSAAVLVLAALGAAASSIPRYGTLKIVGLEAIALTGPRDDKGVVLRPRLLRLSRLART
jgi:hypothetical protein